VTSCFPTISASKHAILGDACVLILLLAFLGLAVLLRGVWVHSTSEVHVEGTPVSQMCGFEHRLV